MKRICRAREENVRRRLRSTALVATRSSLEVLATAARVAGASFGRLPHPPPPAGAEAGGAPVDGEMDKVTGNLPDPYLCLAWGLPPAAPRAPGLRAYACVLRLRRR